MRSSSSIRVSSPAHRCALIGPLMYRSDSVYSELEGAIRMPPSDGDGVGDASATGAATTAVATNKATSATILTSIRRWSRPPLLPIPPEFAIVGPDCAGRGLGHRPGPFTPV